MFLAPLVLALVLCTCGPSGIEDASIPSPPPGLPAPPPPADVPPAAPLAGLTAEPGTRAGTVVLRFPAPGAPGDQPADAYVVRSAVRHITEDTLAATRVHATSYEPSAPGERERIEVGGLEPGRTLQLAVQARRGGTLDPVGYGVGVRVPGTDLPAPPGDAIRIDGASTLSQDGATYLLTRDVSTAGTAFRITGADITLDLGGHTVTYGAAGERAYGVIAEYPRAGGTTVVRNGRLVQGSASGARAHAVFLRGLDGARVSHVAVQVRGPDTNGMWITEADEARVDHCAVECATTRVTNRHYPGVTAIFVEDVTGPCEVDQNVVTASPQWGIRVHGRSSAGDVLVHHNRVVGTRALVANGYMLAVHKPDADVFENVLDGASRGIHVDGIDGYGRGAWIHDNAVTFQDQPNEEYPDRHWGHGIKVEGATGCLVEHNLVRGLAEPGHADVYALDLTLGDATGLVVRHNVFEAVSRTASLEGRALKWTYGANRSPADALITRNVFQATDTLVYHDWDGGAGGVHLGNWWVRDLSAGAAHPFRFQYFLTGDRESSRGHRFVDPVGDVDVLDVEQWGNPGAYETTREWTLRVQVTRGATPVAGARVAVRDGSGSLVLEAVTDADGRAAAIVPGARITPGPRVFPYGPHLLSVATSGTPTFETTRRMEGPTSLQVDLATGVATFDAAPPDRVGALAAHALSASRALLTWEPARDDTGVSAYLVYLDDRPMGITDGTSFLVAGLEAGTRHTPSVRAVDAAGRIGPARTGEPLTTRSEDRGP